MYHLIETTPDTIEFIDKYLSEQDKDNYVSEFDIFESSNYNNILTGVYDMYDKVKKDVAYKSITDTAAVIIEKQKRYEYYLNPKSKEDGAGSEYFTILSPLITRTNILN